MTSRERLLTALQLKAPDRVPISTYELAGFNSKSFENNDPSYKPLMDAIREKTDCICMWNPDVHQGFLRNYSHPHMDVKETREDSATVFHRTIHTPKGDLTQSTKVEDHVHTVWQIEHWCKSTGDVDKYLSMPFVPQQWDFSDYARINAEVGDHGILMASLSDPLYLAADLMEFGEFTVWALTETDHFARTVEIMHERNMEDLKRMLASPVLDLYRICGPEYATPPYLPPEFFKRFVKPYVKQIVDLIHSKGAKARVHCHGKIAKVLDLIRDTGADGVDPCEAPPDGDITLAEVKKRVGNSLTVFGNLQLKLLEHGSTAEVERAVMECMDSAKKGGGYVIMPTAAPINSPLSQKTQDNYLRFIDAAREYGGY